MTRAAPTAHCPQADRTLSFGDPFIIQWHLLDTCNLACRHCYRDGPPRDSLDRQARRHILERIRSFLERLKLPGRLHLAGGEPMACDQLPELVEAAGSAGLQSRILSNGTLAEPALARHLARCRCVGVQVSIEGPQDVHDCIRGEGSFERAMLGVGILRQEGLVTTLAATLHQENLYQIEQIAALARERADRAYFSRLIPLGRGARLGGQLDPQQWQAAMRRILSLSRQGHDIALRDPTFRPWFASPWNASRAPVVAGCAAGWHCLAIESDGTIYPCRRLPLRLGNALHDDLHTVFSEHPLMKRLRNRDSLQGACGTCHYRWVCGGCRAIPNATTGEPFGTDSSCPWANRGTMLFQSLRHLAHGSRTRLSLKSSP